VPEKVIKQESLLRRQAILELSLRDLRAGKRVDHLTGDELVMLISGIEARLIALREAISAEESTRSPVWN
jgi:hypothetical protein